MKDRNLGESTTLRRRESAGHFSLVETIASLHAEYSSMQSELRDAHGEIDRLRRELAIWPRRIQTPPAINLSATRRRTAFYCHPDRGGDEKLMSNLNVLFDFWKSSQRLYLEVRGVTK